MTPSRPLLRPALLASVLLALLALPASAGAARTVYFAETGPGRIAQFAVSPSGAVTALDPASVPASSPRRLAMTPTGRQLYATVAGGVLQFDAAEDGRLAPKLEPLVAAPGEPHSIAVHPQGHSVYVTDAERGRLRQYTVGDGGRLAAKDPASVPAGAGTRGVAVAPHGGTLYVLVAGGIAVYDIDAQGGVTRRSPVVAVPSSTLEDLALTPDGARLYATALDGRIFQFAVAGDGTPAPLSPAYIELPFGAKPVGIAVAPDGSAVYAAAEAWSGGGGRHVFSYVVGAGGELAEADDAIVTTPGSKLRYLTTSPSGRQLFVGGYEGHVFDLGPGAALTLGNPPTLPLVDTLGVVVSPNQAPVANFSPLPGAAGSPTVFDASAASDPDGTIVRYDWDFGDGTTLPDGGPTPTHVYSQPGTYIATLVVTDNEGASTSTVFTGGTVLGHGTSVAQASVQVVVLPAATEQPPAPVQEPLPDLGETLVAAPVSGRILVRRPGARRFVALEETEELPLGSVLDTRRGRVRVATERRRRGLFQAGVFYGGRFLVRQRARDRFITDLLLRGPLACPGRGEASAALLRRRRLWGSGSGRFRTRGRYSSGAVRGTRWLVEDRCSGTLTIVRKGTVRVRDFSLDRTIVLKAGERYLARRR